ncbi:site-specific DNA-methyltransferase (adenine-specific)/adenine-specific DNA-methyltransferase [Allochromatium warmingii]|uniref:site-specific DNA-methyltransferase (adenine-specific) n=1 Tax=Allochromatium warmingii TaxID=61595 RepID=A0A1H3C0D4_ALLWA|nr:site-specific DNA-methyltransferase [Allochromatium warmingii]SDX47672.1 site-specific DNA-methyltransferase (adenine-specific)/adenine-specific DNA-methyltransferase [Allochromatium warmingii]
MPSLTWIGKDAVLTHHRDVPFRLLEPVPELSCIDPLTGAGSGNLLVQGDNLHALKALLPRYAGQVKCIYIDPPYNTGNEGWIYNDNVNSSEIRRWLGEVVGREGETLDRHDRWLCMMYPRLMLLKQFLREDGAIFVSIDDNEVATLRLLMDEIFGAQNFVATVVWQKKYAVANDHKTIAPMHDFLMVYQRSPAWTRNLLPRGDEKDRQYRYEDEKGIFRPDNYTCNKTAEERPNLYYPVLNPNTGEEIWPKRTAVWRYSKERHEQNIAENLIYWGKDGTGKVPAYKRYKNALRNDGVVPQTLWLHEFAGHTDGSRKELREVLHDIPSVSDFATPKPTLLIQRILQIATDKDSLILDSFAGSGTTAHAVLKQNAEDGGNRRFILVEMDDTIARTVTAERVRRIATGYTNTKGTAIAGLGGGFQFCRLSAQPLFDATGEIRADVTFAQLAEFVWFAETGSGYNGQADSPLLGIHAGRAIYLLYNGILKDRSEIGGNVLTTAVLDALPPHHGPKVIYAAANQIGASYIAREGIVFKQTPYALEI